MSPRRAARICSAPGCSKIVPDGGRCPEHKRAHQVEYDQKRGKVAARGYGAPHRRWRDAILAQHPVCVVSGCGQPSTVADHIVPLRQGGSWSYSNGQGMCERHHNAKRASESHQTRRGGS